LKFTIINILDISVIFSKFTDVIMTYICYLFFIINKLILVIFNLMNVVYIIFWIYNIFYSFRQLLIKLFTLLIFL